MTLNEKILLLRKKAGLSQEDLANEVGVSRQTVYKWESGDAQPELAKIKWLAKYFNVSFDYLMDDEIESEERQVPEAREKIEIKERHVFLVGETIPYNHADIDNGHAENRKAHLGERADDYLFDSQSIAKETLEKIGATDIFFIQGNSSIAYFYDSNNKVCGFYYNGKVQLVCPIENIIGIQSGNDGGMTINTRTGIGSLGFGGGGLDSVFVGSMPSQNYIPPTTAWALFSYKDGKQIKELKLDFNVNNQHLLDTKLIKDVTDIHAIWDVMMRSLMENLKRLELKIVGAQREANSILTGKTKVEDIDKAKYKEINKEAEREYEEYKARIEEEAKSANLWGFVNKLIIAGLIVGGAILICVLLFGMI